MVDSSSEDSRKRSRESDLSLSSDAELEADGQAFDEDLSEEFEAESSGSLVGSASNSSRDASRQGEGTSTQPTRTNVRFFGYDEHGERRPSQRPPRPVRSRATGPGLGTGQGDAPGSERADGRDDVGEGGCGVGEEGSVPQGDWDADLGSEFEGPEPDPDLFDDEETASQARRNPFWARRTERELREWKESRHVFAAALLRRQAAGPSVGQTSCSTSSCEGRQAVRCAECTGGAAVCEDCDEALHPYGHFHQRKCLMPEGRFWRPIGPDFQVREGKLERCPKTLNKPPSASCTTCGKHSWGAPRSTKKPLTVVTLAGRFDFVRAVFYCQTGGCGGSHEQGAFDAVDLGVWPGTVSDCRTMYDTALLDFWDKMSKDQPGASMTALVKVLEGISRDQGRVRLC